MKLVHFSDSPLHTARSVDQWEQPHFKPLGLWVSVEGGDDSWSEWCKAEDFAVDHLLHPHKITLRPDATILRLRDPADIDAFTREYVAPLPGFADSTMCINWCRVARKYQGVIIAPYVWARRLDIGTSWYYAWDCASGCIWDANAIERIDAINPSQLAELAVMAGVY